MRPIKLLVAGLGKWGGEIMRGGDDEIFNWDEFSSVGL